MKNFLAITAAIIVVVVLAIQGGYQRLAKKIPSDNGVQRLTDEQAPATPMQSGHLFIENNSSPLTPPAISPGSETITAPSTEPTSSPTVLPTAIPFNTPAVDPDVTTTKSPLPPADPPPPTSTPSPAASPTTAPSLPTPPPFEARIVTGWYTSKAKGEKVPILMYHNLIVSGKGDGLNVSEKVFENQMKVLKEYGYNTITFEELYAHYMTGASLPRNPIIITFDDGYKSNYTIAYPILKKYGHKATIFIITNAIGKAKCMTSSQIKEISESGVIDIQAHSVTHDYHLNTMKRSALEQELADSKRTLEGITGKPVRIFCYPFGKYSTTMINVLIEKGYVFSVTTKYGCAKKSLNPYELPRLRVDGRDSGVILKSAVEHLTGVHTKYVGDPQKENAPVSEIAVPPLLNGSTGQGAITIPEAFASFP